MRDAGLLPYGLNDVEQVRLLLQGNSAIDWQQLAFVDHHDVDRFLRLCGFHVQDPTDVMRLVAIHRQAIAYLEEHFEDPIDPAVKSPADVRDLLLIASRRGPAQPDACKVLKVMHVVHHVGGRELLYRLPVPAAELFFRVEKKVFEAVDGMKAAGVRVAEFSGSRKTPDSVLTKLLSRRDSLAASVHDRVRFRVVTETMDDLLGALVYITREMLPFNYVVPGESTNDLIDLRRTLQADPDLSRLEPLLQRLDEQAVGGRINQFSSSGYRVINFVADVPIRVDDLVSHLEDYTVTNGITVFLMVEFQLVDRETDAANNTGANRHSLYKARQYRRVKERLEGKK